jgi:hypothetical protein
MKWPVFIFVLLIVLDFGYAKFTNTNSILSTFSVLSNYQAKQICSCLYVEENAQDYCKKWVSHDFPLLPMEINQAEKKVSSLLGDKKYVFKNEREGCAQQ